MNKNKFIIKSSPNRGTVTSVTVIDRKKQIVFCTDDCYITIWDYKLSHLIDFIQTDIAMV
jgi:hypothetical protein